MIDDVDARLGLEAAEELAAALRDIRDLTDPHRHSELGRAIDRAWYALGRVQGSLGILRRPPPSDEPPAPGM